MNIADEGIDCEDPRFAEILEACLRMEITAYKESTAKRQTAIKKTKLNVLAKLEKRKELKRKIEEAENLVDAMTIALNKLQENARETTERIELMKVKADERSKQVSHEVQTYQQLLHEYEQTWQSYRDQYEDFPWAKKRNEAVIRLEKARIERNVFDYKLKEMEKMIRQRNSIGYVRMKGKIVELARVLLENRELEQKLANLHGEINFSKKKLRSNEMELSAMREQQQEKKKARVAQLLEMLPPKINLSGVRLNYPRRWHELEIERRKAFVPEADALSVNTVVLEELCISEESADHRKERDLNSASQNNLQHGKSVSMQMEAEKSRVEEEQRREQEAETEEEEQEDNAEEILAMEKEIQLAKENSTMKRGESVRRIDSVTARNSQRAKTSEFNVEDENAVDKLDNDAPTTSKMRSSFHAETPAIFKTSLPRVKKIEKFNYTMTPIPKFNAKFDAVLPKQFATPRFNMNDSRANSPLANEELAAKEGNVPRSVYGSIYGDSVNFKMSDISNISNLNGASVDTNFTDAKIPRIDKNKKSKEQESPVATPQFNFGNILKMKAEAFHLF